jgi:hypothetical protein
MVPIVAQLVGESYFERMETKRLASMLADLIEARFVIETYQTNNASVPEKICKAFNTIKSGANNLPFRVSGTSSFDRQSKMIKSVKHSVMADGPQQ